MRLPKYNIILSMDTNTTISDIFKKSPSEQWRVRGFEFWGEINKK